MSDTNACICGSTDDGVECHAVEYRDRLDALLAENAKLREDAKVDAGAFDRGFKAGIGQKREAKIAREFLRVAVELPCRNGRDRAAGPCPDASALRDAYGRAVNTLCLPCCARLVMAEGERRST